MNKTSIDTKPVLLITGASSGLGDGIARRFASEGYRMVVLARRKDRLDQLARDISPATDIAVLAADVTAEGSPERAVELAMSSFGRLDCLVNNAGAGRWAPVHATDDATMNEVIETSLKAPIRFARAAVPVMRSGSSIINIGSVFGLLGGMDGGVYCAAKAGLIGLTQTLAVQYGSRGIRSNLVAPGVVKTEMTQDYWDAPAFQRINQEMTPMNRECTVEDVANAVYFLASNQGSFINGHTLVLDGGWSSTKFLSHEALLSERLPLSR